MKNLFWVACFSRQRELLKVPNTSHIGYIIGGSQTESKSFAPHHLLHGCETLSLIFHAHPKEFIYFFESFLSFVSENDTSNTKNIGHPSPLHEQHGHTKEKIFLRFFRDGTCKFT
jgi:hypothetical protein